MWVFCVRVNVYENCWCAGCSAGQTTTTATATVALLQQENAFVCVLDWAAKMCAHVYLLFFETSFLCTRTRMRCQNYAQTLARLLIFNF